MKKSIKFLLIETILLLAIMTLDKAFLISGVSIVLHELAHIVCAKIYGCSTYKMNVSVTGANARINDVDDLKDFQKFNLYMVGPLTNLVIFIVCSWMLYMIDAELIKEIAEVNLGLFIFNMIPAYPLDGARIIEIILARVVTYRMSKKVLEVLSIIFSIGIIGSFGYTVFLHKVNISLLLVAGIILYSTYLEHKSTIYIMMGDLFRKGRLIEKYEYIDNRSISVSYKNNLLNILRMVDKNKFNSFYILDEELKFMGIMHEDELLDALKIYGNITIEEYLINKAEKNS